MITKLDKYVLQLILYSLPTSPSWIILSMLNRRWNKLCREAKAIDFVFPDQCQRRRKRNSSANQITMQQLETVLCDWKGLQQLKGLDLSNVSLKNPIPDRFIAMGRLSNLERITFNTVKRQTIEAVLFHCPNLRSITVLNAEKLCGSVKIIQNNKKTIPDQTRKIAASSSTSSSSSSSFNSSTTSTTSTTSTQLPFKHTTTTLTALRFTNLERARVNTITPMLKHIGCHLRILRLNGSPFIDTSILKCLHTMKPPPKLKELSLAQCQRMEHRDIELFLNKCGTELEWLDLSFCRGVGKMNAGYLTQNNATTLQLPHLKTVLFDQCLDMEWHFLYHLTVRAPNIEMISARGCKVNDLAFQVLLRNPRANRIKSLDICSSLVTEEFVSNALELMINLTFLGIEGCRGVGLKTRQTIRDGVLGKDRRKSMYVYIDDEQDHRNARIRHVYERRRFVPVTVDSLIECEEGQRRKFRKTSY